MISCIDKINDVENVAEAAMQEAGYGTKNISYAPYSKMQQSANNGGSQVYYFNIDDSVTLAGALGSLTDQTLFYGFLTIGGFYTAYTAGTAIVTGSLYRAYATTSSFRVPFATLFNGTPVQNTGFGFVTPGPVLFRTVEMFWLAQGAPNWSCNIAVAFNGYRFWSS